jgi:hypothetical protein
MDASLTKAIEIAKSVFTGEPLLLSSEAKRETINIINEQVQRLMMKPGDPVPLGLTFRQRYETLILLEGAIVEIQGRSWHSEDYSYVNHEVEAIIFGAEQLHERRVVLEACWDASTEERGEADV